MKRAPTDMKPANADETSQDPSGVDDNKNNTSEGQPAYKKLKVDDEVVEAGPLNRVQDHPLFQFVEGFKHFAAAYDNDASATTNSDAGTADDNNYDAAKHGTALTAAAAVFITQQNQLNSPLLRLPGEIRNKIFKLVHAMCGIIVWKIFWHTDEIYPDDPELYEPEYPPEESFYVETSSRGNKWVFKLPQVCRQVYAETRALPYALGRFIFDDDETLRFWMGAIDEYPTKKLVQKITLKTCCPYGLPDMKVFDELTQLRKIVVRKICYVHKEELDCAHPDYAVPWCSLCASPRTHPELSVLFNSVVKACAPHIKVTFVPKSENNYWASMQYERIEKDA